MTPDDLRPATFEEEEAADLRRQYLRHAIRLVLAFALLFSGVFFALWWSGAAVRFSTERVGDRGLPTWYVMGTVRHAVTHAPVPWVGIEDDPAGRPPFHRTDGNQYGEFELLTFAEPHRIRVSAPGFRPATISVGRVWFLWLPRGKERHDVELLPSDPPQM